MERLKLLAIFIVGIVIGGAVTWYILFGALDTQGIDTNQEEQTTLSWQEQYDFGVRYLLEGNYEEAILAFTAAIELEPTQPAVYLARGEAYALFSETVDDPAELLALAISDYEMALTLDDTLIEAEEGLALILP